MLMIVAAAAAAAARSAYGDGADWYGRSGQSHTARQLQRRAPATTAAAADPTTVKLGNGDVVRGVNYGAVYRVYRGLPFAAPPIGDGRWQPPRPAPSWGPDHELLAYDFAPPCAQHFPRPPANDGESGHDGEDCLYLNVFAPPRAAAAPDLSPHPSLNTDNSTSTTTFPAGAPVWVFLHGGGFESGGVAGFLPDSILDPRGVFARLSAATGDRAAESAVGVVVVTLTYRLGVFGFLGGDAVAKSTSDGSSGNFGVQDQRQALKWIQQHIASFGGDPGRVMLFGNSAGGDSTATHLVMARSAGLFHAAALESGGFHQYGSKTMAHSNAVFDVIAKALGCDGGGSGGGVGVTNGGGGGDPESSAIGSFGGEDPATVVACMRQASVHDVLREGTMTSTLPFNDTWDSSVWCPTVDGVELADSPLNLLRAGRFQTAVPVIVGTNADDGTEFITADRRMQRDLTRNLTEAGFRGWLRRNFQPEHGDQFVTDAFELYRQDTYDGPGGAAIATQWWWRASRVLGDHIMSCAAERWARWLSEGQIRAHGTSLTFRYFWSHIPLDTRTHGLSLATIGQPLSLPGACHGCEIGYVFGASSWLHGEAERALSEQIIQRWLAFSANPTRGPQLLGPGPNGRADRDIGDGGGSSDVWPRYTNASAAAWHFATPTSGPTTRVREAYCRLWDRVDNKT